MTVLQRVCLAFVLLLSVYVGAYLYLSRRGDAWCRPYGFHGFLYVLPDDCENWDRWHQLCRVVFRPANDLERAFGGELYPVQNICGGLSK